MARYLNRDKFHLTICALRDGGWQETQPLLEKMDVPAFVTPFRPTGKSVAHFINSFRRQKEIAAHGPFDVQHSMDFTSSPFEAIMARMAGRAYIYSQRNLNENGHKNLLRMKTLSAKRIIGISDSVVDFLEREGVERKRVDTVYLGLDVDQDEFRPAPAQERLDYILMVGQFERRKRHGDAIRAFAAIAQEFPSLELLLAGNTFDRPYEDGLRQLASNLSVSHRVQFLGPRRDVIDLMRKGRALLLCSEQEAFGWVLLEAMAAGIPLISSASEGPSQVVQHERTGLLVPIGDVDGYVTALRRVLRNEDFSRTLAAAARSRVEQEYSAEVMVRRTESIYTRIATMQKKLT